MKISFITPSYNNLEYLQLCYNSIKKYCENIEYEHCIADDGSSDGTSKWLNEIAIIDKHVKPLPKEKKTGHTELYNELVNKSTGNVIFIFHADMFLVSKNTIPNMLKYLKSGVIVSATRVEPIGMYPPSPEKILIDFGGLFVENINLLYITNEIDKLENLHKNKTINSIFAPWMCFKEDYLPMDKLYSPYPHEDQDVFLRFVLKGYKCIQSFDALVPHFCSRGHRKTNKDNPLLDNSDYSGYETRARRNFWRKWHSWMNMDSNGLPIYTKTYNIGLVIKNCNYDFLKGFEPFCNNIYIEDITLIEKYIKEEQNQTLFDLSQRIKHINQKKINDVIVTFTIEDVIKNNDRENAIDFLLRLSNVILETGTWKSEFDTFEIDINNLRSFEQNLVDINDTYYQNQLLKTT